MNKPVRHIFRILSIVLVPAAFGGAGGWLARAIGAPAVADGIDIIAFVILGLLAGWAFLALLSHLPRLPGAWRDWRAGILLPVLMKEMRSSMRGLRVPALMLASAGLAAAIGIIFLVAGWSDYSYLEDVADSTAAHGGYLVRLIFLLGAVIALVLAPALTAGAVSREREGQTLELLLLTRMSAGQIAWGKLLSGLSLLGLIVLCALPVAGIGFMLGGMASWQLLAAVAMLAAAALCFGAIGLWCSTRFRRTAVAIAVAYVLCGLLIAFTPFMTDMVIPMFVDQPGGGDMLFIWLQVFIIFTAAVLLLGCGLSTFRRRMSRGAIVACLACAGLVFILGSVNLHWNIINNFISAHSSLLSNLASEDWSGYIEYIDPTLAFGILLEPSGYFEYYLPTGSGFYAEFDEDWPIILTNIAVFLLIARFMLSRARRALHRLRIGTGRQRLPTKNSNPKSKI